MSKLSNFFFEGPDFISTFVSLVDGKPSPSLSEVMQHCKDMATLSIGPKTPLTRSILYQNIESKENEKISSKGTLSTQFNKFSSSSKSFSDDIHSLFKLNLSQKELLRKDSNDYYNYIEEFQPLKKIRQDKDPCMSHIFEFINDSIIFFISKVMDTFKASSLYIFQYLLLTLSVIFFLLFLSFRFSYSKPFFI